VIRPRTLPEALAHTAGRGEGTLTFHPDEGPVAMSAAELAERALAAARALSARGVGPGDAVGVLGPNRPEWAVWAWATWAAGATLVPLQIPMRVRDPGAFADQVRSLVSTAGCRVVMGDPRLLSAVEVEVGVDWAEPAPIQGPDPAAPGPEDPAVIQFTSGSTSRPKGALLTHRAVMAQMGILDAFFRKSPSEHVLLGWVPFFHDLGLFFYVVMPTVFGGVVHHLPTERFAADPAGWLRLLTETGATATVFPPSAMGAAVRAAARRPEGIDLSGLEVARFAAEGVDPEVADRVFRSAERFRLSPEALGSTYGLAEAVLGVTSTSLHGMRVDRVDVAELAASGRAVPAAEGPVRRVVSSGRPAPGTSVRIVGAGGDLTEREVGEIYVRGPSLMTRYVGPEVPDPFVDGWLRTGDMGYIADGDLYVTGRIKDMVIVMGHNYYPEDFEWAAGRLDGVRTGRCVAFGRPDAEGVVLMVEPVEDADLEALPEEVKRTVGDALGVVPAEVVVVPPGTVEKTTSGKLRRSAMRKAHREPSLASPVSRGLSRSARR
jgi:fatty-acyl-CoA synthase